MANVTSDADAASPKGLVQQVYGQSSITPPQQQGLAEATVPKVIQSCTSIPVEKGASVGTAGTSVVNNPGLSPTIAGDLFSVVGGWDHCVIPGK
eukprot:gene17017-18685_t